MEHTFGQIGPYFRRPNHRDHFSSLSHKVGGEGSSAIPDMGYRFKRSCTSTREAQRRAAQAAKEANVQPARLYLRSTSRGLLRAIDIYLPRLTQDEDPDSSDSESQPEDHKPPPAPRQAEGHSCRGTDEGEMNGRVRKVVKRIFEDEDVYFEYMQRHKDPQKK